MSTVHMVPLLLLIGVWLVFIGWTIRRLGAPEVKADRMVFKFGVKQFGVGGWLIVIAIGSYSSFEARPDRPLLYYVGMFGFIFLPMCLWLGFAWGKGMSACFPNRKRK